VDSNASSKIKLRMIGGKGMNSLALTAKCAIIFIDLATEANSIVHANRSKNLTSSDP